MNKEKQDIPSSDVSINSEWDSLAETEEAPLTRSEIAKLTGSSISRIRKEFIKLKEEGEEISTINIGEKRVVEALTQKQFEKIRDRLNPLQLPPKGAIPMVQFAKDIHINPGSIHNMASSLGIILNKYKNQSGDSKGGATIYLTPEQQTIIQTYVESKHGQFIQDGFIPAIDVAKELGLYDAGPIFNYFNKKNEHLEEFRQKGIRTRCLSKKQYVEIKEQYPKKDKDRDIQRIPDDNYKTVQQFADEIGVSINTIRERFGVCSSEVKKYYYDDRFAPAICLSKQQQQEIMEDLEKSNQGTSRAELTIGYYLLKNGFSFKHGFRPDWMKNPNTGHNLEIDYYINPPGIGIEYDGSFFHQDVERDILKDNIAKQSNIAILHIRDFGCPKAPENMLHIDRSTKEDDSDFSIVIASMLKILGVNNPDVDIKKDKSDIFEYMRQLARKKALQNHLANSPT